MEGIRVLSTKLEISVEEEHKNNSLILVGTEGKEGEIDASVTLALTLTEEAIAAVFGQLPDPPFGTTFDAKVFILFGEDEALESHAWDVIADRLSGGR